MSKIITPNTIINMEQAISALREIIKQAGLSKLSKYIHYSESEIEDFIFCKYAHSLTNDELNDIINRKDNPDSTLYKKLIDIRSKPEPDYKAIALTKAKNRLKKKFSKYILSNDEVNEKLDTIINELKDDSD